MRHTEGVSVCNRKKPIRPAGEGRKRAIKKEKKTNRRRGNGNKVKKKNKGVIKKVIFSFPKHTSEPPK